MSALAHQHRVLRLVASALNNKTRFSLQKVNELKPHLLPPDVRRRP